MHSNYQGSLFRASQLSKVHETMNKQTTCYLVQVIKSLREHKLGCPTNHVHFWYKNDRKHKHTSANNTVMVVAKKLTIQNKRWELLTLSYILNLPHILAHAVAWKRIYGYGEENEFSISLVFKEQSKQVQESYTLINTWHSSFIAN